MLRITVLLFVTAFVCLGGCTTVQERFVDQDPDRVWLALVRVAESPDYESTPDVSQRWIVEANDVAVFEEPARIEIYRELTRVRYMNTPEPHRESQTWRFQVVFDGEQATFTSRGWGVPAYALLEGERYFADVRKFLGIAEPEPVAETFDPEAPVQGGVYDD